MEYRRNQLFNNGYSNYYHIVHCYWHCPNQLYHVEDHNGNGEPAANHQRCGISRNGVRKRNCYCFRKRSGELFLGFGPGFSGVHSLACQLQHLYCDR